MNSSGTVFDPGSVLIDGDEIAAILGIVAQVDVDPRTASAAVVDATGCAVIPGLHNCHLHSGLLRGTAESLSLWDSLKTYVDPAHRALTPEIAKVAVVAVLRRVDPCRHHVVDGHVAVHGRLRGSRRRDRSARCQPSCLT